MKLPRAQFPLDVYKRQPAWGGTKTDVLDFGRKYNEVERAVCWQRIAPPFGTGKSRNRATVKLLRDWTTSIDGPDGEGWLSHVFDDCEEIEEFAPWMITRDMDCLLYTSLKTFSYAYIKPRIVIFGSYDILSDSFRLSGGKGKKNTRRRHSRTGVRSL